MKKPLLIFCLVLATFLVRAQDTVALRTIVNLQSDTVPLFIFGAGSYNLADTVCFSDSTYYGTYWWSGSDTAVITELRGIICYGSGVSTVGVQVYWNDSLTTLVATKLNAAAFTVDNDTVADVDVAFSANVIPPNNYVWMMTPTVTPGLKPSYLSVTLSGYKRNRTY